MKIRPHFLLSILVLLLIGAPFAAAQWDKKPSSEWSEHEAQKLLNDSPWAQTQSLSDLSQMTGNSALNAGQSRVAQDIHVNFRVRFLSAKPVRQAVARDMELKQKGKLEAQLAARSNAFAAADFPDFIVITVVCDAPQRNVQLQEAQALKRFRIACTAGCQPAEGKATVAFMVSDATPTAGSPACCTTRRLFHLNTHCEIAIKSET